MKKNTATCLLFLLSLTPLIAQTDKLTPKDRIIEVTGTAEMSITPNEVVLKIGLTERMEGRDKLTIEKQEVDMKNRLAGMGIDIQKDLKIVDLNSVFNMQKRKKDVTSSKEYRLTIREMSLLGKIQDLAEQLKFNSLDLILATHSELPKFRKETKIEAIKSAKEKAEYMLAAIGQKLGKVVFVQEVSDYRGDVSNQDLDPYRGNMFIQKNTDLIDDNGLGLKNITLKFCVLTRFEIE
jgi:uncharacterized protein